MSFAFSVMASQINPCKQYVDKFDEKIGHKLCQSTTIGDMSVVILALVFAILAQTNVIAMPPCAAYALFSLAGFIVLADLVSFVIIACIENKEEKKQPEKM